MAIWCVKLAPGAKWALPAAKNAETVRTIYFFRGPSLGVAGEAIRSHAAIRVRCDVDVALEAGEAECEILVLQGRPIGEPVVAHGPFVMNTRAEIERAFSDYQRTRFGGWPRPSDDPVHPRDAGRFARHADGRVEQKEP